MNSLILKKIAMPASKLIKKMAVFSANSVTPAGFYCPVEPTELSKFKKCKTK
jgi:cyclic lactone autoinducer peptide